jgi:transketolase
VKLAVTHCGLDVGEDGRTHHCLDYVGALRGLFGWRVIVPADPNQTDRAVRVASALQGNVAIAMGRSALPVIEDADGNPLFAGDYGFVPGIVDWAREGTQGAILTMGTVAGAAVAASDELRRQGFEVAVGIVAMPLEIPDAALKKATSTGLVFTAEDHCVRTGLGASVAEWMAEHPTGARLVRAGVEGYRTSGLAAELLAREGLDAASLAARVLAELQSADGR